MWKVYNIQSGKIVKMALETEEEARTWLEVHRPEREDSYAVEEMDSDEVIEWETKGNPDEEDETDDDYDFEKERYSYKTEDDEGDDDDEDMLNALEDGYDEDEDE